MSYFVHLSDRSINPLDAVDARGSGHLAVVGESFYARNIGGLVDSHLGTTYAQALLVREPRNHYDPNCVAVYSTGSKLLGHLSRQNARCSAGHSTESGGPSSSMRRSAATRSTTTTTWCCEWTTECCAGVERRESRGIFCAELMQNAPFVRTAAQ